MEKKQGVKTDPPGQAETLKCWEFFKCADDVRADCPAFTLRSSKECWMITEKLCCGGTKSRESIEEKLVECSRCAYYTSVLKKG